ncbi:MAG: molybdate ABC transporter substrate-binding protein [Candidatus Tectomicrobia bacterium]|nr:molybdate ABC transporter substrate-binding protein [Candidatus Tectomicrobia bacterium]
MRNPLRNMTKTIPRGMLIAGLLCMLATSSVQYNIAQSASPLNGTLTVFAAVSLTEAFTALAQRLKTLYPGLRIQFNFAGSQSLRTQLEQGAPADVFASANVDQMELAQQSGVVLVESHLFVKNRLVVIAPRDNPGKLAAFRDLATPGLKLVLAGPHVPVGQYSRQALRQAAADYGADFEAQVLQNLVSEEHNVKQVVTKVQLAEADAGITYVSDITPRIKPDILTLPIPEAYNQIATYPIALVNGTRQRTAAQAFIDFVRSDPGQALMASYNFIPVKE